MTEESVFTLKEFRYWLRHALPGERVEYFLGRLDEARYFCAVGSINRQDLYCADAARAAAREGLVTLLQRRIRRNLFSYLAVRMGAPIKMCDQQKKTELSHYSEIHTIGAPPAQGALGIPGGC